MKIRGIFIILIFSLSVSFIFFISIQIHSHKNEELSYLPKNNAIYEYYYSNLKSIEESEIIIENNQVKQTIGSLYYDATISKYCYLYKEKDGIRIRCEYGQDFIGIKYPIKDGESWTQEILNEGSMGGTDKVTLTVSAINQEIITPAGTFKNVIIISEKDTSTDYYYAPDIGVIRQDFMKEPILIINSIKKEPTSSVLPLLENNNAEDISKDFNTIASDIANETLKGIFDGYALDDLNSIIQKFGRPIKENDKSDYERWYFADGIELDIASQGVDHDVVSNYAYINPFSNLKTSRSIGIGSSRTEVFKAYESEINSVETNTNRIVVGNSTGVVFVMKNNRVNSIYIGTGYFIGEDTEVYFTERD